MNILPNATTAFIAQAGALAGELGSRNITPEHLILTAVHQKTPFAELLKNHGWDEKWLTKQITGGHKPNPSTAVHRQVGARLSEILHAATRSATKNGVTPEHLIRTLFAHNDPVVRELLKEKPLPKSLLTQDYPAEYVASDPANETKPTTGPDREKVPAHTHNTSPQTPSGRKNALETFGQDLLRSAREGKFLPVYGRDSELRRVETVLARRTKANPILIGEPGVGKTAIIEALASRIVKKQAPKSLHNRPLIQLDVAGMLAGTKARGDFEQRVKQVLKQAETDDAVLFIDEIHQVMGAGDHSGGMDVANMLKEVLTGGQITLIGATTLDEYREYIEKDPAFTRRFEPIRVEAPSVEDTVLILKNLQHGFAQHHGIKYTPEALETAARLADRHIPDRQLPDKAIDVLDEAGAAANLAMCRISDEAIKDLYQQRQELNEAIRPLVASENYEACIDLAAEVKTLTKTIKTKTGIDYATVTAQTITDHVAKIAGLPAQTLATGSTFTEKLKNLATDLKNRVVGQEQATTPIAKSLARRHTLGATRPAAFLLAGPTGVGKTETAKGLADLIYGTGEPNSAPNNNLIRFDMSEFAEKHTVSRLIGAAPGYAGYENAGELTEKVRRNPHSILLLDEVEKAHPSVYDIFLHVLEEGHLTDSQGRKVSFKDTTILLTTNLGSSQTSKPLSGFVSTDPSHDNQVRQATVLRAVKDHFRPEFINRLDDVLVYNPLTQPVLETVLTTLLQRPLNQLAVKGVNITLSPQAHQLLLTHGHNPTMGARPLRRAVTNLLETPLADALIAGELPPGTNAYLDVSATGNELVIFPAVDAPSDVETPITSTIRH